MEEKKLIKTQARKTANRRDDFFDLMDLFGFYVSRLPLLIAAMLLGAVAAGLWTYFMIPDQFTATSRMYMVSASSDSVVNLTDLNIGTSLSSDYVELMQTRPVIEGVIEELGLDYSYERVLDMLSLSVVNNTRIVKISVTSTDPREAMDIANQMAKTSQVELPKVMEAPTPTIAEMAVLPTRRSAPSLTKNVVVGAAVMLALTLGVLALVYSMDDTIKTSEDLEKAFGVLPLSVIPEGRIEETKKEHENGATADGAEPREFLKAKRQPRRREGRE
ncbi:MAG: capsular polysaccharide biosynthesis protein [Clostridia bacterium]|nr:capsular polysaccharide biosynthesis protein [Clostridia bacterium]